MLFSSLPANKFPIPFANSPAPGDSQPIPTTSQISITSGASSLPDGFPPLCFNQVGGGGGIPPWGRDFNGFLNQKTAWSQWQQAGNPIGFDSTFANSVGGYPQGAIIASTTPGNFWISKVDNNLVNPDSNFYTNGLSNVGAPNIGNLLSDSNWFLVPGIIDTNITFTCNAPTNTGHNAQFTDLNAALEYLSQFTITDNGYVTIQCLIGSITFQQPTVIDHPNSNRLTIAGSGLSTSPAVSDFPVTGTGPITVNNDSNTASGNMTNKLGSILNYGSIALNNVPQSYPPFFKPSVYNSIIYGMLIISPGVTLTNLIVNGSIYTISPVYMGNVVSIYRPVFGFIIAEGGSIKILPNSSLVSFSDLKVYGGGSVICGDGSLIAANYGVNGFSADSNGSIRPGYVDISQGALGALYSGVNLINPNITNYPRLPNSPMTGSGTIMMSCENTAYGAIATNGGVIQASLSSTASFGQTIGQSGVNSIFKNNGWQAYNGGNGLYASQGGIIKAPGALIENNATSSYGGIGVYSLDGSLIDIHASAVNGNGTPSGSGDLVAQLGSIIDATSATGVPTASPAANTIGNNNSFIKE